MTNPSPHRKRHDLGSRFVRVLVVLCCWWSGLHVSGGAELAARPIMVIGWRAEPFEVAWDPKLRLARMIMNNGGFMGSYRIEVQRRLPDGTERTYVFKLPDQLYDFKDPKLEPGDRVTFKMLSY